MKKLIAILLVLLMLAAMTACVAPIPTTTPGKTEPGTTTTPTTVPPTTVPPTTAAPEKEEPFIGETVNNVYTNGFLGITCQLDAQWTVFNKEQLAQLMGLTSDLMNNDAVENAMENGTVVMAFYAQSLDGTLNMNIALERLSLANGILMDEESYINVSKSQLAPALESMGMENVTVETAKIQFAGEERHGLRIHATIQGIDFDEALVCIKNGNYIASVTVGTVGENKTDDLLAMFKRMGM
jgi:hypothetical protein